jgi:hypothetical protein
MDRASIITMVRIPFVNKFESQTNLPCKENPCCEPDNAGTDVLTVWVSHIVLCSNVETGIGCFASSIPSLRHLFQREGDGSSDPNSKRYFPTGSKLITASGKSRRPRGCNSFRNPTDIGFSLSTVHHGRAEDNWERLQDAASDKSDAPVNPKRIYAERSYTVDVESA